MTDPNLQNHDESSSVPNVHSTAQGDASANDTPSLSEPVINSSKRCATEELNAKDPKSRKTLIKQEIPDAPVKQETAQVDDHSQADNHHEEPAVPPSASDTSLPTTSHGQEQPPLLNASTPSPGNAQNTLALMTEQQHQQFLQSYAHTTGQDLANLTASSLAQAMISPIAVPAMTSTLLQQLHSNVITALPGPPSSSQPTASISPPSSDALEDPNHKRSQDGRNLSNDERRQRRLMRNRLAAKECRKKKKVYIQGMEEKIAHLEEENARLQRQVDELKSKLALGAIQQGSETYRLMKEVEELNAKLGSMGEFPGGNALTTALMATASAHPPQTPPSTNTTEAAKSANDPATLAVLSPRATNMESSVVAKENNCVSEKPPALATAVSGPESVQANDALL